VAVGRHTGRPVTVDAGKLDYAPAFERDVIRERTVAGLAVARAGGKLGGRPPIMTAE